VLKKVYNQEKSLSSSSSEQFTEDEVPTLERCSGTTSINTNASSVYQPPSALKRYTFDSC